ncbi:hypothetical protein [Bradyrhizobium retamae]|nr:hypothetical protein [Bradyrhizobium retamae]
MASKRLNLTPNVVKEATTLAIKGTEGIEDFCDKLQPYLVLRVRGHVASWLVKTRTNSIKIGSALPPAKEARIPERRKRASKSGDEYLGLREARDKAKREWAKMGSSVDAPEEKSGWTWGELVEEYKKHISEMREDSSGRPIYPSAETQSDVRQIFARPAVAKHADRPLSGLNEEWFETVQEELHRTHKYDGYRKFRAYGQAALNWASAFKRRESGLPGRKWWLLAEKRRRTAKEVEKKIERDKALKRKKKDFTVKHLGMLLAEHERFCASRAGNERISPGVRWGLWWDSLTGHRRGSGTWIAREDVEFKDPRAEPGWGLATWQPNVMKTQNPFTLPIPPLGLHIVRCCMRDWKRAAERAGLWKRESKWVFASRVMQSETGDIAVSGSALANHIRNMRGLREGNHRDVLRGIPPFSMHIIRSTMGDHILDETELPPGTASLVIGHEIAGDRRNELDRVGQTGKRWYFQAQRIPEKTKAMELWADALLKAFLDAGGIYPE